MLSLLYYNVFQIQERGGTKMESLYKDMNRYAPVVVQVLASAMFNEGRKIPFTGCYVLAISTLQQPRQELVRFGPVVSQYFLLPGSKIREPESSLFRGSARRMVDFLARNPERVTSLSKYTQSGGIFFVWEEAPTVLVVASYCHELDEAAAIALGVLCRTLDEGSLRQILVESPNRWVAPLLKELLARYPDHQYLKKVLEELETQATS